jgi:hypothetical protein
MGVLRRRRRWVVAAIACALAAVAAMPGVSSAPASTTPGPCGGSFLSIAHVSCTLAGAIQEAYDQHPGAKVEVDVTASMVVTFRCGAVEGWIVCAHNAVVVVFGAPGWISCFDSSGGETGYPAEFIVAHLPPRVLSALLCTNADALTEEVGAGVLNDNQVATSHGESEYEFTDNNRITTWHCWVQQGPSSPYTVHIGGASETAPDGLWNWLCYGSNGTDVMWRGTVGTPRPETPGGPYLPPCWTAAPGERCRS